MASMELQGSSETVQEVKDGRSKKDTENVKNKTKNKNKKTKKRKYSFLPKFGCLALESEQNGSLEMEADCIGEPRQPATHLVVMVHGIIGSAQNWRYAEKQFVKKYPRDVIVHCSERNSTRLTFDGVDVMGKRLAEEVISVINCHPDLQKISFVGHSLGGLVARYAIAKLYGQDPVRKLSQENGDYRSDGSADASVEEKLKGKIAGLEPMNFITSATPHLGSRGHKQVPILCGFYIMEKTASRASWFLGRTGRHLFLTDRDNGKLPLLLQMVKDCEDLPFMSALQSFKRRVVYANARYDNIVGWSTSSLRRRNELPKRRHLSRNNKYRHIVNVEIANPQPEVSSEAKSNGCKTIDMEEEMIRALTKLSWERVDVSFRGIKQPFLAHTTIQASLCFLLNLFILFLYYQELAFSVFELFVTFHVIKASALISYLELCYNLVIEEFWKPLFYVGCCI
ncbi:hypothetical protein L1049_026348 [Liquidambar formosana]|uniref:DUF676 domain-containing protein n=1 Tax=Liquidambar formosana TaxID=63359 RepID=A0AAP0R6C3_LIQFO